jgi:hypothetical protein
METWTFDVESRMTELATQRTPHSPVMGVIRRMGGSVCRLVVTSGQAIYSLFSRGRLDLVRCPRPSGRFFP